MTTAPIAKLATTAAALPTTRFTKDACVCTVTCEARHLAYVKSTRSRRRHRHISVDFVLFLTGWEAEDAAAARGDESPPPNDYYIVNDTTTVREFPVQAGIAVRVVVNPDGTTNPDGYDLPLDEWIAAITGSDAAMYLANAYWLDFTGADNTICAIEAQWVP